MAWRRQYFNLRPSKLMSILLKSAHKECEKTKWSTVNVSRHTRLTSEVIPPLIRVTIHRIDKKESRALSSVHTENKTIDCPTRSQVVLSFPLMKKWEYATCGKFSTSLTMYQTRDREARFSVTRADDSHSATNQGSIFHRLNWGRYSIATPNPKIETGARR